jgi:hypothetical protein
MFRIYYSDGSVRQGESADDWAAAPYFGVQVVARLPRLDPVRWMHTGAGGHNCAVMDRDLWTGDDFFDPFLWGAKEGELLSWPDYIAVWERACGDN